MSEMVIGLQGYDLLYELKITIRKRTLFFIRVHLERMENTIPQKLQQIDPSIIQGCRISDSLSQSVIILI